MWVKFQLPFGMSSVFYFGIVFHEDSKLLASKRCVPWFIYEISQYRKALYCIKGHFLFRRSRAHKNILCENSKRNLCAKSLYWDSVPWRKHQNNTESMSRASAMYWGFCAKSSMSLFTSEALISLISSHEFEHPTMTHHRAHLRVRKSAFIEMVDSRPELFDAVHCACSSLLGALLMSPQVWYFLQLKSRLHTWMLKQLMLSSIGRVHYRKRDFACLNNCYQMESIIHSQRRWWHILTSYKHLWELWRSIRPP